MPITKSELAAKLRAAVPSYGGRSDDDLVKEYVSAYPDQAGGISDWRPSGTAQSTFSQIGGQADIGSTPAGRVGNWLAIRPVWEGSGLQKNMKATASKMDELGMGVPTPFGIQVPASLGLGLAEGFMTPLGLATAPLMAGSAPLKAGAAALGKYGPAALKAIRGLDIGTNLVYGGQGLANVSEAVSNSDQPAMSRLGQGLAGAAQVGMSTFSLQNPTIRKTDVPTNALTSAAARLAATVPPATPPIPPPVSPNRLALPPAQVQPQRMLSGWPEDVFYSGAGGVSRGPEGLSEAAGPGFVAGPQGAVAPVRGNLTGAMRQATGQSPEGTFLMGPPKGQRLDPTLEVQLGRPAPPPAIPQSTPPALPAGPTKRLLEAAKGLPEAPAPTPVKATYIGDMGDGPNALRLYNITEGGDALHPVNSTISERTLVEMGGTPAPPGTAPAAKGQELGFIAPRLVNALAGGAAGAAIGAATADTPEDRLRNAAILGGVGAAGGAAFIRNQRPGVTVPRLMELARKQRLEKITAPNPLPRRAYESISDSISQVYTDTFAPLKTGQNVILRKIGKRLDQRVSLSPEDDAYQEVFRQMGSGESREAGVLYPFMDMQKEAEKSGLADRFADYMNLQGLGHAADTTFPEHIQAALHQHRLMLIEEANARIAGHTGKALDYQEKAAAFRKQANDIIDSLANGELLPEGYNPQTLAADRAAAMTQFTPDELAKFQTWEQSIRALNKRGLDLTAEMARPETILKLEQRTAIDPRYNPLTRILDNEEAVRRAMTNRKKSADVVSLDNVMNYLEGSERTTMHPLAASLRRFVTVVDRVERNRVSKAIFNLRQQFNGAPEWDMLVKPVDKNNPLERGWSPMHYYDQGHRVTYQLPVHVAKAVKGMTDGDVGKVGGLYSILKATGVLARYTAIMGNPAFVAANTVRDPGDVMVMARGVHFLNPADQAKFGVELAKAWKDVLSRDKSYIDDLLSIGGGNSGMAAHMLPDAVSGRGMGKGLVGGTLNALGNVSNASEMAPKLALARILKSKVDPATGRRLWSDDAIAYEVRNMGSPDFWRRGSIMANMGEWVFLLNGAIQGIARQTKYFTRPEKFAEALLGAAGISMFTAKIASQVKDSDGQPSIRRASTEDLLNYFVVPIPFELTKQPDPRTGQREPTFAKIPMPFSLRPFMIPLQLGLYKAMGLRDEDAEQIMLSTLSTQLPGQFNLKSGEKLKSLGYGAIASSTPLVRTGLEQIMNRDTGFDIPIETDWEKENLKPVDRWSAGTSPLARLISSGLVKGAAKVGVDWEGISPKRIEHFTKKMGLRTGILEPPTKLVDTLIADAAEMPTKPTPKWGEDPVGAARTNPITGMFARRFVGTGVDQTQRNAIDQMYDLWGKVSQTNKELIAKTKIRPEEVAEMWKDPATPAHLAIYKSMEKIVPQFTKLHQQRAFFLNHPGIPDRDQILKALDQQERQLLEGLAPQFTQWNQMLRDLKSRPKLDNP